MLTAGTVCTKDEECARGHDCAKIGDAADFTCVAYASQDAGIRFTVPAATTPSHRQNVGAATLTGSTICKTRAQTTLNNVNQCRTAQRSVDQVPFRDNVQATCKSNTYVDENLDNFATATPVEVAPLCGFNSNSSAVCPMYPGDDKYLELVADVAKFIEGMNCHRLSGMYSFAAGQVCQDYYLKMDDKEAFKLFRLGQVGDHQTFANTANNDQCTARTITFRNWNGFDSAHLSYGVVGMIATALTYIMM